MKKIETEILVLGGGLAGTASALSARKSGNRVALVCKDGGASAMSSGALDIAGDILAITSKPEHWRTDIAENLEEILIRNPEHPYHLLGDSGEKVLSQIKTAFELVFPSSAGFLHGDFARNQKVFNQMGTFKLTAFFQQHMLTLDDLLNAEHATLINFPELNDFDGEFFKKNFEYWSSRLDAKTRLSILNANPGINSSLSCLEFAKFIEQNTEQILEKLDANLKKISSQILVLPPVLPGRKRLQILENLKQASGANVRELLALPPSVAGKRLQDYLEDSLKFAGVEKLWAKAVSFKCDGKKIISVQAQNRFDQLEIFAHKFILASGSFLAGGLTKLGEFKESIFGLEVFSNSHPIGKIFTEKLTGLNISAPHPVFSLGVKTSSDQRPIGSDARIVFENLFAAGSILSGANYIFDGTGAGVALATGLSAEEKASKL